MNVENMFGYSIRPSIYNIRANLKTAFNRAVLNNLLFLTCQSLQNTQMFCISKKKTRSSLFYAVLNAGTNKFTMQNPSHRPAIVIISHVNDWKSTRFGLIRIVIDSCMALRLNKKSVSHFIGKPLNNLARWNDVRKHVHAEDNGHSKRKKQTTDGRINGKWKFPRFDLIVFFLFVRSSQNEIFKWITSRSAAFAGAKNSRKRVCVLFIFFSRIIQNIVCVQLMHPHCHAFRLITM